MKGLIALVGAVAAAAAVALLAGVRLGSAEAAGPFSVTVVAAMPYAFQDSNGNAPANLQVPLGSSVTFTNPSGGGFHDVDFDSLVPSACTGSASVGSTSASLGPWQGSCTFNSAGTYAFHCSIHFFTGEIVVGDGTGAGGTGASGDASGASGATGASGTGSGDGGASGSSGTTPPAAGAPAPTASAGAPATSSGPGAAGAGGPGGRAKAAIASLAVPADAHGFAVSASALLGHSDSTLTASLRLSPSQVVGRRTQREVGPGRVRFTVALDARGRRLLRARRSLTVSLVVTVSAPGGTHVTRTRTLRLHA